MLPSELVAEGCGAEETEGDGCTDGEAEGDVFEGDGEGVETGYSDTFR